MPMMSPRHKHLLAPVVEQLDPPTLHDEALQDAVRNALQERPRSLEECAGDGETAAAAGELQRRRSLAALISQTIKDRRLSQNRAGLILGTQQSKVSKIMRGQVERGFSQAKLLEMLTKLGHDVTIVIEPVSREGQIQLCWRRTKIDPL